MGPSYLEPICIPSTSRTCLCCDPKVSEPNETTPTDFSIQTPQDLVTQSVACLTLNPLKPPTPTPTSSFITATSPSFVGSYENCLFSGRFSASSTQIPFSGILKATTINSSSSNKSYPRTVLPFNASYYDQDSSSYPTLYIASIDLDSYFWEQEDAKFPGYRIPEQGHINLAIENQGGACIKLFSVPYNLNELNAEGKGGKTFLRQSSYLPSSTLKSNTDSLRYAIHLQFCSPPRKPESSSRYYLYSKIRVVFAPSPPDDRDKLETITRGPSGILEPEYHTLPICDPAAYTGPGKEWAQRKSRQSLESVESSNFTKSEPITTPILNYPTPSPFNMEHESFYTLTPPRKIGLLSTPPESYSPPYRFPHSPSRSSPLSTVHTLPEQPTTQSGLVPELLFLPPRTTSNLRNGFSALTASRPTSRQGSNSPDELVGR